MGGGGGANWTDVSRAHASRRVISNTPDILLFLLAFPEPSVALCSHIGIAIFECPFDASLK